LQIDVASGLSQPDRSLGSAQFDEAEFFFQHFEDGFEVLCTQPIRDVIEFHPLWASRECLRTETSGGLPKPGPRTTIARKLMRVETGA
jgi:hypothetical protein